MADRRLIRAALALALCATLEPGGVAGAGTGGTNPGGGGVAGPRLQGTWAMSGRITRADNVRGERKGQKVARTWTFKSSCSGGKQCRTVTLTRRRPHKKTDTTVLQRKSGSRYAGRGRFFVALRCAGKTYKKGGLAPFTIAVTITKSQRVQTRAFVTRIRATYNNPRRINRTPCAGGIGSDAATYTGRLTSAVPGVPKADFTWAPDAKPLTVAFSGTAKRGKGGARIVAWRWNFGDGNTATERSPTHTYTAPKTYTVTLKVTDANGLTSTVTKQVTVP
jgi:PKD domain-containing protein